MAEINRRDMCAAVAAFAMLGEVVAKAQTAQTGAATASSTAMASGTATASGTAIASGTAMAEQMVHSRVFRFSELRATANANGGWGRGVVHGTLPTGEFIEVHETMLPAGKMPHPPHRHANTEFILLREGTVAYLTDFFFLMVSACDVIYTASNQPHGMVNAGSVPALYYVVSVGVQPGATEVTLKAPV